MWLGLPTRSGLGSPVKDIIMDCLTVPKRINLKIEELEKLKESLDLLAVIKAEVLANYERRLSIRMLELKQQNISITLIEKVARGDLWELKLAMDLSESKYKNALKIIDITEAQLNGYQSINRYLAEV